MVFPLRGVEIISLVLKIYLCDFNCPSIEWLQTQTRVFCAWLEATAWGWGVLSAQRCEMIAWRLVYRLELCGTISRPAAMVGRVLSLLVSGCLNWLICSLAPVSRAVLEFGATAYKSVTGLTVASCALFVWFGAGPWSSICWVVVHAGCFCWWLRNTVLPAASLWAAGAFTASTQEINHSVCSGLFSSSRIFFSLLIISSICIYKQSSSCTFEVYGIGIWTELLVFQKLLSTFLHLWIIFTTIFCTEIQWWVVRAGKAFYAAEHQDLHTQQQSVGQCVTMISLIESRWEKSYMTIILPATIT